MKGPKSGNHFGKTEKKVENISKTSTRPQTALEISQNMISTHSINSLSDKSNMSRAATAKMLKTTREQRKWNMIQMRKDFKEETKNRRNKSNRVPLIADDIYDKELQKFNNKQPPGPGYYIDIEKESDFFKRSIPYPEFRQFFLSNNERFPEEKINPLIGPTTYFKQNFYYGGSFNNVDIEMKKDKNKIKETPFNTREKRFNNINAVNGSLNSKKISTPGPGAYNPETKKDKIKNNMNYMFNCRQKRFGPSSSELKWVMMTPGPGAYINTYNSHALKAGIVNGTYSERVRHVTWLHTNMNGMPERRYKNNPQRVYYTNVTHTVWNMLALGIAEFQLKYEINDNVKHSLINSIRSYSSMVHKRTYDSVFHLLRLLNVCDSNNTNIKNIMDETGYHEN